ncbi:hypothetical protein [uncultured Thiodictyon sp.]|uniref:hypothetical protein n=1 Tax=uncultured Thiodictyon sp. TaxID=1846217 RepID=UPI0025F79064|nr:hypothetical protein [uncultured Thiodictyon sp.]
MAGKFLRGAFVQFMETFLIPLPNAILFQFNPESIVHAWSPAAAPSQGGNDNPLAVSGLPGEKFDFTLHVDAADMIADGSPVAEGLATVSGVYTRLAALEMLMHPTGSSADTLLGAVSVSVGAGGVSAGADGTAGSARPVPAAQLPTVLFVWGPGRVLPVKVTSLSITETRYDATLLNPTHAEARVGLAVLTPKELQYVAGPLADIARGAYVYSQGLREALAIANLANSAESIIGMLPL